MGQRTESKSVGARVRRERTRAGLSLSQLATETGISKAHLVRLETKASNPSLQVLSRIADALDLTVADLVGGAKLTYAGGAEPSPLLERFIDDAEVGPADARTLASIRFRQGEEPRTLERWRYIYDSLMLSRRLDDDDAD